MSPEVGIWIAGAHAFCRHLWQSTAFVGVAVLLALVLRGNQARTRYWIWMAASAKFLIPFSMLVTLGSYLPRPNAAAGPTAVFGANTIMSELFAANLNLDTNTLQAVPSAPIERQYPLLPIGVAAAWLLGVLGMLAYWCMQYRQVAKALRSAVPLVRGREVEVLRRLEQASGLPRPIPLLSSSSSMEPGVVGILRPVLLWPVGVSQHLEDAQLERILMHEACHVRRKDNLTSVVPLLVKTIFWFHPLVWWVERQLVTERERACDEDVLLRCGEPRVYAEGILKVCAYCVASPLTCVSGISGSDLKRRVNEIMAGKAARQLTGPKKLLLAAVAFCAIGVPVVQGQFSGTRNGTANASYVPTMTFDVVSIRESQPQGPHVVGGPMELHSSRIDLSNVNVMVLLNLAYGVPADQHMGNLPDWGRFATYDVHAKGDPAADEKLAKLTDTEAKLEKQHMLQALLAERFKFKSHRAVQEGPIYRLVVAHGGVRFHAATQTEDTGPPKPKMNQGADADGLVFYANALEMGDFTNWLTAMLHRPVHDGTGLAGKYDFALHYFKSKTGRASDDPTSSLPLEAALLKELGLKLVSARGPVDMLVIDRVERPSPN